MEGAGESETTVTKAVGTCTDRATLSLAVISELSQHMRFSNNNNQTKHKSPTGTEYANAVCHSQKTPAAQLPAQTRQTANKRMTKNNKIRMTSYQCDVMK